MLYFASILVLSFSLYAPITSDVSHAWFLLNTAIPADRNKEQAKILNKFLFIVGFEHPHSTVYS